MTVAVQEEILNFIETLPEEFSKLKIKIEMNEELSQELKGKGYDALTDSKICNT